MSVSTSTIKSLVIQACMTNDLTVIKPFIFSESVEISGQNKEKFFQFFEKTVNGAHRKAKGDWNMSIEPAEWLKEKNAVVYDFYEGKGNQPVISVVVEEKSEVLWMEVLK
ncbi:MAG: hypothetical protein QNK63_00595 [Flavobacteriales bacterium]|jgi:hypothetical protein